MFIVEGNIGAGKSTFLKLIKKYFPHIVVIFEPIHNWQSKIYGQSILSNFYSNPKRWAYTMETLAMASRVQEYLKEQKNENPFRLIERSIYSGHYCFAKNGYQKGYLNNLEWNLYLNWFNFLIKNHCKEPRGFIYLKVDPDIAYKRIKKRNRISEKEISLSYIKNLHTCHEEFLIEKKDVLPELKKVPVLTIDCNEDFEENTKNFLSHAISVEEFIIQHNRNN